MKQRRNSHARLKHEGIALGFLPLVFFSRAVLLVLLSPGTRECMWRQVQHELQSVLYRLEILLDFLTMETDEQRSEACCGSFCFLLFRLCGA
ncbi:hypothetical protein VNO80_13882 [Phaseolus coccineus]|uniref:Uncharacterized protein n=1 Tax=Phaseolus coccineus TaxID=3886 RepID=A0AAN9N6Z6_PHACN